MTLTLPVSSSSSGSVSSLRSVGSTKKGFYASNTPVASTSKRLSRIFEESKYDKHRQQQVDDQKMYIAIALIVLFIFGVWHFCFTSSVFVAHPEAGVIFGEHASVFESRLQSLRRTHKMHDSIAIPEQAQDFHHQPGKKQHQKQQHPLEDHLHSHNKFHPQYHDSNRQDPRPQVGDHGQIIRNAALDEHRQETKLEEEMTLHIEELKRLQLDEDEIDQEYEEEIKAQLEEKLMNLS